MRIIIWETKGPSSVQAVGWVVYAVNSSGVRCELRTFWDNTTRTDGLERAERWIDEVMIFLGVTIQGLEVIRQ